MSKTKIQTVQFSVASGVTAGTRQQTVLKTDIQFDKVVGFAFLETANSGSTGYNVELTTKNETLVDAVPYTFVEQNSSVKPTERFFPCNIKAKGEELQLTVIPRANTTAVIEGFLIVLLQN